MSRTPRDQVDAAFGHGLADPFSERYLMLVLERWSEIQVAARRTGTTMVTLIAVFLLLASAKGAATIDFGPLKHASTTTILVWIPAVISFLGLELMTLQMGYWRYEALVTALVAKLHPGVVATKLHHALSPATIPLWGLPGWERIRAADEDRLTVVRRAISGAVATALVVAWILLFGTAYDWLDDHTKAGATALYSSMAVTFVNVVRGILLLVDEGRAGVLATIATSAPRA
jgi:hypothetical protein